MFIACFIGDHSKDSPLVRLGWWVTRLVQKGEYWRVTHVEAILKEHPDGSVDIGSASLREGSLKTGSKNGVRTKERVRLNPEHWIIFHVPWNKETSRRWFKEHDGELYAECGAFATPFPIQCSQPHRWFCNQAVGAPFLKDSHIFGPSQFAAILDTIGYDVTDSFFERRQ
jgi:hypothetical protein